MTRLAFTILLFLSVAGCQTAAQRPKPTLSGTGFIAHTSQSTKQFWSKTAQIFHPLKSDSNKHGTEMDALFASSRRNSDIVPANNSSNSLYKAGSILPSAILVPQQEQDGADFLAEIPPSRIEDANPPEKKFSEKNRPEKNPRKDIAQETAAPPVQKEIPDEELVAEAKQSARSALARRDIELPYSLEENFEDDFDDEPLRPIKKPALGRRTLPSREETNVAQSAIAPPSPVYPFLTQSPGISGGTTMSDTTIGGTVQASYQQSLPPYAHNVSGYGGNGYGAGDWQTPARQSIEQLRYAIEQTPNGRTQTNEMRLRMMEMMLGNKSEAAKPMQSADKTINQFMSHQVLGLATLLDDSILDNRSRYVSAAYRFNEGLLELQNLCPLKLKNMTFVDYWQGYGQYISRPNEYHPGDKFMVYMELENPTIHKIADGYEVNAKIDYEIRDEHAKIIDRKSLDAGVDRSLVPKRDYCLGFPGDFPESLAPGLYQLQITVSDLNDASMHRAQEQIPFRIVPVLAGEKQADKQTEKQSGGRVGNYSHSDRRDM